MVKNFVDDFVAHLTEPYWTNEYSEILDQLYILRTFEKKHFSYQKPLHKISLNVFHFSLNFAVLKVLKHTVTNHHEPLKPITSRHLPA